MASGGFKIDVDLPKLVTIGAVSVLVLIVIFIGTNAYYLKFEYDQFVGKHYDAGHPLVEDVNAKASQRLHAFRWVDQKTNTAQIPIDQAIKMMAQSKGRPPTTQPMGPTADAGR